MATLQTLERGLVALELISRHPSGVTVAEVGEALDVHRTIAYRLVSTLVAHGYVVRTDDGRVRLGAGVATLAGRYAPALRHSARPVLAELARDTLATSYLAVAEGPDCVVVAVDEPAGTLLRVGYRVGSRHPLVRGASGIAILSGRPAGRNEEEQVARARELGYAITQGQLQPGAIGIASPIGARVDEHGVEACVGVVALEGLDVDRAIHAIIAAASRLRSLA